MSYQEQRKQMVKKQIIARGIGNPLILEAMNQVPRHLFVPRDIIEHAYEDRALSIGYDQTISQPYIVAFMTEILDLKGGERVLEIGTGCGYQASVLGKIVDRVYTMEIVAPLAQSAKKLIEQLGYDNIEVFQGDGFNGWAEHAPYHGILVACAPKHLPPSLPQQLEIGGKIIIPVGEQGKGQELICLERKARDQFHQTKVLDVRFVPMTGEIGLQAD